MRKTVVTITLSLLGAVLVAQAGSTSPPGAAATYLPSSQVAAAFEKGMPLLETPGYKIHASRREAPGMAEVHVKDVDVIYVLGGAATIVTGGSVVDGKATASDEVRGASIEGGNAQRLAKGDVLVVPNGVPHQFTEVTSPFLYYVVKSTAAGGRP
jgi:mannose-6-phosphate isomerase-like protein (cupin superfamily)